MTISLGCLASTTFCDLFNKHRNDLDINSYMYIRRTTKEQQVFCAPKIVIQKSYIRRDMIYWFVGTDVVGGGVECNVK